MKKWYTILVLILALCFLVPTAWAEELSDEDDAYEYEDFEYEGDPPLAPDIELASNPSTGYHWFYTCDEPEVVEVTENGFVSGQEGVLGAPGVECFRLNGYDMGVAVVTFSYARSAEETPLYTITYHVQVSEAYDAMIFETSFDVN